ncbi:DUF4381 domain-containing protein [Vibrio astriarenae]|jgi:hypothetical protein
MQQPSETLPLKGLHLPEAPSWFPLTPAWWASFAGLAVVTAFTIWLVKRHRAHRVAKNAALKLIVKQTTPSQAMEVVRQVAFSYYDRKQLASLTGEAWYQFLDKELGNTRFEPNSESWQSALYTGKPLPKEIDFIADCEYWIRHALPPKKRGQVSD